VTSFKTNVFFQLLMYRKTSTCGEAFCQDSCLTGVAENCSSPIFGGPGCNILNSEFLFLLEPFYLCFQGSSCFALCLSVGKITEKAVCRSVFLTTWRCNLSAELTKNALLHTDKITAVHLPNFFVN